MVLLRQHAIAKLLKLPMSVEVELKKPIHVDNFLHDSNYSMLMNPLFSLMSSFFITTVQNIQESFLLLKFWTKTEKDSFLIWQLKLERQKELDSCLTREILMPIQSALDFTLGNLNQDVFRVTMIYYIADCIWEQILTAPNYKMFHKFKTQIFFFCRFVL